MRKLLFASISLFLIITSCKKTDTLDLKEPKNVEIPQFNANRSEENIDSIMNHFKQILPVDSLFIENFLIDQRIHTLANEDTLQTYTIPESDKDLEDQISYLNSNMEYFTEDIEHLGNYLNEYGHQGDSLVSLFTSKVNVVAELLYKYPELDSLLSQEELNDVFMHSYNILKEEYYGRTCAQSYTADIEDCDDTFAWATFFTIVEGVEVSIVGTPVAGEAVVGLQIGSAYIADRLCRRTAARHYRECMGYE